MLLKVPVGWRHRCVHWMQQHQLIHDLDEKVEKFFVEEHHYEPDIEIDPQYASMMKLWKVATPKARKAAMEVLRVMSDADE